MPLKTTHDDSSIGCLQATHRASVSRFHRPNDELCTVQMVGHGDLARLESIITDLTRSRRGGASNAFISRRYMEMKLAVIRYIEDGEGGSGMTVFLQEGLSLSIEFHSSECAVTVRWVGGCTYPSDPSENHLTKRVSRSVF